MNDIREEMYVRDLDMRASRGDQKALGELQRIIARLRSNKRLYSLIDRDGHLRHHWRTTADEALRYAGWSHTVVGDRLTGPRGETLATVTGYRWIDHQDRSEPLWRFAGAPMHLSAFGWLETPSHAVTTIP